MEREALRNAVREAHRGRYLVKVRAVNPSGNTVEVVGYVTEARSDGGIRLVEGDARRGQVHAFPRGSILSVERVHAG